MRTWLVPCSGLPSPTGLLEALIVGDSVSSCDFRTDDSGPSSCRACARKLVALVM